MPYPWECLDCRFLDPNDYKYGEYYCQKNHYYVVAASPSCRHYEPKKGVSSSNCYLTTISCYILGKNDKCHELETLRWFRDNYMSKDERLIPLLEDYDDVGPVLCSKIVNDDRRNEIANAMFNNFIKPAVLCIECEDYDKAIDIYEEMTINLMSVFDLDTFHLNCYADYMEKAKQRKLKESK